FFLWRGRKCTPLPARFTPLTRNAGRTRESARFKTALGHTLGLALSNCVSTHSPNVGQALCQCSCRIHRMSANSQGPVAVVQSCQADASSQMPHYCPIDAPVPWRPS
ncbi:unnamed protein product, partial [Ixodes persulcatus]